MKKYFVFTLLSVLVLLSCEKSNSQEVSLPEGTHKIKVVEFMNASGYTYILASENGKEFWIAIRQMPVEKGDILYFTEAMEMKNFKSKSLDKTFEKILFVNEVSKSPDIATKTKKDVLSSAHTTIKSGTKTDVKVEPLSDGVTVKEIYEKSKELNGKKIKIKGVVTRYNANIMGRNWIHIQDGTSFNNHADITVTSNQETREGETIIVEGVLAIDKDFGAGYRYDAIIENATITPEKKS